MLVYSQAAHKVHNFPNFNCLNSISIDSIIECTYLNNELDSNMKFKSKYLKIFPKLSRKEETLSYLYKKLGLRSKSLISMKRGDDKTCFRTKIGEENFTSKPPTRPFS